jgi:hypothetical protein
MTLLIRGIGNMTHAPLIKRLPAATEVSCYWNKFRSADGALVTVESVYGIHHFHLSADTAISLRDMLTEAIEDWQSTAYKECHRKVE